MNDIIEFGIIVVLISASGVMTPGPLLTAAVAQGLQGGVKTGVKMALGHTIVELPLIVLLGVGIFSFEIFPEFRIIISIVGAIMLFVYAAIQIRTALQTGEPRFLNLKKGVVFTGVIFTALNPFFIIWWLTIGFKLISDAVLLWAYTGIGIIFLFHIWMDFVWLGVIAFFSAKSLKFLSSKSYKILMIGLSFSLIYFGLVFIFDSF